jgi:site-specific DNA-methyltransferase (adenine-specific)
MKYEICPCCGKPKRPKQPTGRWPANLLHDGSDEVVGLFPVTKNGGRNEGKNPEGQGVMGWSTGNPTNYAGDTGSAARFFYCAKASKAERDAGCEALEERARPRNIGQLGDEFDSDGHHHKYDPTRRNHHPTVKPLALTEYLARLILPPQRNTPRRLLIPFSGSGSEMIGALKAGWDEVIGIELDPEYVAIAEARLAQHCGQALQHALFSVAAVRQ